MLKQRGWGGAIWSRRELTNGSETSRSWKQGIQSFVWWNETQELKVRKLWPMGIQEVFLLEGTVEAGILKDSTLQEVRWCMTAEESFSLGLLIVRGAVTRGDRGEAWIRMECSLSHFQAPRHKYLEHLKFQQRNATYPTVAKTSRCHQILANICNRNANPLIARENMQWCSFLEDSKTISYKTKNPSPWDSVITLFGIYPKYCNFMPTLKTVCKQI